MPWAHPRSRGENARQSEGPALRSGSSPLTRGKQPGDGGVLAGPRLIPAHAGKTTAATGPGGSCTAHPRSRGENCATALNLRSSPGSSPLTRGKRKVAAGCDLVEGLIPAHAGKTQDGHNSLPEIAAHPRSRGENVRSLLVATSWRGSSPLTRGKPRTATTVCPKSRLIPAHAGKTADPSGRPSGFRAHPRSRGENSTGEYFGATSMGSSPLTRGKHGLLVRRDDSARLIPAHAGKTWTLRTRTSAPAAHPRSRGENIQRKLSIILTLGSSPLTRGKRADSDHNQTDRGLIPAHAGKTCSLPRSRRRGRAHPRSRGENAIRNRERRHTGGSSPLTRGKPRHWPDTEGTRGLIPAHAGKTRGAST